MKPQNTRLSAAALTAVLALTAPVLAQTKKSDVEELASRFASADKDVDGKLTLAEAKAGMPRIAANFDKIDKDRKGFVTLEEIKAMMAKR
jgi:Ca2+-binding EF-hand superfamily protein